MGSSISQPNPLNNHHHKATAAAAATTNNNNDDYQVTLTNMIGRDLNFMKETMTEIQKFVDHMNVQINQASKKFEDLKTRGGGGGRGENDTQELGELKKAVKKLKSQIPSKLVKIHYDDGSKPYRNPWFDGSINSSSNNYQVDVNKAGHLNSLYKEPKFDHTTALEDIQVSLPSLPPKLKDCLTFFLMLPEMGTIKKRLVIHWWIGARIASPLIMDQKTKKQIALGKTAEDFGYEFLDELTERGFIEPIYKNCGLVIDSYRMHSNIHSALKKIFFISAFTNAYIVTPCDRYYGQGFLNFAEAIVDSRFERFSKFVHFNVVYLGRWQNSVTHHIEVPDIKILKALRNMKKLRFLSLRGISLITELPQFISQLTNLEILDLKACHNLEVVPDWIGLLKNLTHLDIFECYLLDHMPMGLGALFKLQVLTGFIIGDSKHKKSCTINDLTKLPKLRKLSISTSMKEFPTYLQLRHLQRLKSLQKLKISWSGCILQGKIDDSPKQAQLFAKRTTLTRSFIEQYDPELPYQLELPLSLKKLELECFPEMTTPSWLWTDNLKNLKKLYI
ncbi:Disease resistance RPP13-like protein 4 [Camellia lanceoleosa]|uniref:Disease resistance RPP13-like protein 4 n=1 Tax=Camellia lanceoleosa TaxID=1840588 RepID=A0ACC0G3D4_9ERIC|nr:Disease resistance RPP13-like protein 4 [Camellia lanceoleosa]